MDSSADEHFIRLMQGCYVEANRTAASEAAGEEGEAVRSRAREVARETEAAMEEGEEGSTRLLEEWRKIRYSLCVSCEKTVLKLTFSGKSPSANWSAPTLAWGCDSTSTTGRRR